MWSGNFLHSFVNCLFDDMPTYFIEIGSQLTDTEQKYVSTFFETWCKMTVKSFACYAVVT